MLMFYALHQVLGPDAFDRAYRDFFQRYRNSGAATAELVTVFRRAEPRSDRIFRDWLFTTRWYTRLAAGESLRQIVEGYRQP
jgi:aminopeptidase N